MQTFIVLVSNDWNFEKEDYELIAHAETIEEFTTKTQISGDHLYFKIKANSKEEAERAAIVDRTSLERKLASMYREIAEAYEKYNVFTGAGDGSV